MKNKLAVLRTLHQDQLSYFIINQLNNYFQNIKNYPNEIYDIQGFSQFNTPSYLKPNFAVHTLPKIWNFPGPAIATDLESAGYLQNSLIEGKKYFYIWELEWDKAHDQFPHIPLAKIYSDPQFTLIARSDEHKQIIETCWNVNVSYVIDNFKLTDFLGIIKNDNKG